MKTENEILDILIKKRYELEQQENKYQAMNQIDMQSGYGSQVLENINVLKGEIKTLKWVVEY